MSGAECVLLQLLRVALGNEGTDASLPNDVSWQEVFNLSVKQGVVNVAYDGLQMLVDANPEKTFGFDSPEMETLRYKWIGYGLSAEGTYQHYVETISDLAQLYKSRGFRMVLFKGYALSRYYPNPHHRSVGDIDIAILDESGEWCQREADGIFRREFGIHVEKAKNTHHSKYMFRGLSVENHYEFSNTYMKKGKSKKFEEILQLVCRDEGMETINESLFLASPTFNALFLMWHLSSHFCGSCITLRQLCDYMVFMEHDYEKIDWSFVRKVFKDYELEKFARVIDGVLVNSLKARKNIYNDGIRFSDLEERVIKDIFEGREYKTWIERIIRYPRFAWKFKLVRNNSWVQLVISSIKIHLFHKEDLLVKSID